MTQKSITPWFRVHSTQITCQSSKMQAPPPTNPTAHGTRYKTYWSLDIFTNLMINVKPKVCKQNIALVVVIQSKI